MRYSPPVNNAHDGKTKPATRPWDRRGAVAVEVGLLAPFLVLLFGIAVDFARVFYYQQVLNDCARNGCHYSANLRSYQETGWVSPYNDVTDATVAEGSSLNPPLDSSQVSVASGKGSDGNPNVTVTITYPYQTIMSLPGLPSTFNLTAKASMRVAPP